MNQNSGYCLHCGTDQISKRNKGYCSAECWYNSRHRVFRDSDYKEEDRGHDTLCWTWQQHLDSGGYGAVRVKGRSLIAHRWVYESVKKEKIPEGMYIDHLCRNKDCVNPEHLEPVSPAENTRRGLLTILDEDAVREIRRSRDKISKYDLADKFEVSLGTIENLWYVPDYWRGVKQKGKTLATDRQAGLEEKVFESKKELDVEIERSSGRIFVKDGLNLMNHIKDGKVWVNK